MFEFISNKLHKETLPATPVKQQEINPKMILTAAAVGTACLYALTYLVELLISPLLLLASTFILAHIWFRPEKSLLIAQDVLHQTPAAIKSAIQNFPDFFKKTCEISHRIYHASLQSIGNRVIGKPKEEAHTLTEVTVGLATQGIQYAKDTYQTLRPQVVESIESGLEYTEQAMACAKEYVEETIIPTVVEKFNETFPR
jgi:hypothetical protein